MKRSLIFAALFTTPCAYAQADKPIFIGEVAPLTGPAATVGTRLNKASKMWADEVNAKGGINGRKIELVTCNDEGRPDKAAACLRDFQEKGAVMIFGNSLTASLRAMQPLVKNGPLLLIPSPNVVPPADSYAFQVSPSDFHLTEAIAKYMKDDGVNKIGMVAATDASGEVGVESAKKVFNDQKIELRLARIDLRATDASTQLASVAGQDIKLVYSSYTGAGAVTVVKSFKILGLPQPLMVSYGNMSEAFVSLIKDVAPARLLGTSVAALVPDEMPKGAERDRARAFFHAYAKRYNEKPDMINLLGKAETDVAEAVLRKLPNPSDYPAVKKFLESTPVESFHTQKFSPTNHVGLDASSVMIVELKDGDWIKARPISSK
ncbi:MAG TPA: ABC transporter substrate-binding protein [Burkholderiales bacterium]|nr:ABC transporter substrate-binding protein [Burkholderiales bacterium]